ncbi:unnamed protein product [Clonostachys byssicola]|uniref:Uncharacterized protein n=1 Tax=Clonostachys byssicola TaxID=160290 RepID=A0A9N9UGM1_9HYPO|nr:unnamed protein product [Clonostachys byssicola]
MSKDPLDVITKQAFHSMESELAGPFITNARRAASNLKMLLAPHLANIQALLSLHLIVYPKELCLRYSTKLSTSHT